MGCYEDPKEGNYEFFDKVLEYIKKANEAESDHTPDKDYSCCDSFSKIWKSEVKKEENVKTICKQFIKLYKSLSDIKCKSIDGSKYTKDCAFLNYWVNMIIREYRTNNNNCANNFSNQMESHCYNIFFQLNILSDLLYDIKEDDFNKIDILYNLYVNYDNLKSTINDYSDSNKLSVSYSDNCYYTYKIAESMHNDQDNTFNEKLTKFTSEYQEIYSTFAEKEKKFNIYFKRLSDKQNNIITTSVLGSLVGFIPFMGILYKFTPMGQIFRSKNKKFTKEYSNNYDNSISLHQERYNVKYDSVA